MITIISGDGDFKDYKAFCAVIEEIGTDISHVYVTHERGIARMARTWAFDNDISFSTLQTRKSKFMVEDAEDLIYFKKKRAKPGLVKDARHAGLEVYEHEF